MTRRKPPKKIFFVDFENTRSSGLLGADQLAEGDEVHLLYSTNAAVLTIDTLPALLASPVKFFVRNVYVGSKNALDFQLSSLLGYIASSLSDSQKRRTNFYIVSLDGGYDVLVRFWKDFGITVKRIGSLGGYAADDPFPAFFSALSKEAFALAEKLLSMGIEPRQVVMFFGFFADARNHQGDHAKFLYKQLSTQYRQEPARCGEIYRVIKPYFETSVAVEVTQLKQKGLLVVPT